MNFEPFAQGHSPLHRMDPRARVLAAVLFSVTAALVNRLPALALALAVSVVLVWTARLPWRPLIGRLAAAAAFVAMLWAVLPFTLEGSVLGHIGPLAIHDAGLALAGRISLKTAAILMGLIALVATMPAATLGHALDRLGMPSKLTFLLLMCYRYLAVLEQEYQRLLRAARIRGFQAGTNAHTYRTYAYLVGMLFVRAANRGERVHQAMRCRGFEGRFHSVQAFTPAGGRDTAFFLSMALATVAMIGLEIWM